ncbi:hypothetical protein ACCM60_14170 [Pseudomonas chlororaphis subsp. aureofaciens]|uniref:hypothetical protein n=1 Tax=Pseudomonas chlororaphis TaxID=587753 RepID=UPI0035561DC1
MYADPSHARTNVTKVRLNDRTDNLLTAIAEFQHTQKAVLAREILEARLMEMLEELGGDVNAEEAVA